MPRRATRTAALSQDDIEIDDQEHVPSQQDSVQDADQLMVNADEELSERQPVQHSNKSNVTKLKPKVEKVKIEKKKRPRTRRDASADEGDTENDVPAPPFDREEFLATERPIPTESANTIDGIISDLQSVVHQLDHTQFGLILDTAVAVEEVSGNTEEGQEAANKLDIVMRRLIDAQQELKIYQNSLDSLKQSILRGEAQGNLEETHTQNVSEAIQAYKSRTTRQKYMKHEDYLKFRERVWEVNHENAMPPLTDLLPREDADSDDGSDIVVGGMTQDFKCPLTLMPLTDPLTSTICGHSFSAAPIREYIATGRGRMKCPSTGCNQVLTVRDLEPNEELAKRAANALRRAQRREENDETEAEVVD